MKNKIFLVSCTAITLIGGLCVKFFQPSSRSPSSITDYGMKGPEKPHRPFDVEILALNGIPHSDDQEITLRATVRVNRAVPGDLQYKWNLPEGAQIVSGHIEDAWSNVQEGQTVTTELTLTGVSLETEARVITLHTFVEESGVKMGVSGVFSTRPLQAVKPRLPTEEAQKASVELMKPSFKKVHL